MKLEIDKLTAGYGRTPVITDISMEITAGQCVCVLGPNGSGKTTLFKALLGFLKPHRGRVRLNGEVISDWPRGRYARTFGYVPQSHTPPFPYCVRDVVVMGRTCRLKPWDVPSHHDYTIAEKVSDSLGIKSLQDRAYSELSGGERQLVLMARALAQEPEILVLDEPTANLDFGNQVRVLRRMNSLVEGGMSVVMTSHVPNHAFLCAARVAVMNQGRLSYWGDVREVITEPVMRDVYGVDVRVLHVPSDADRPVSACIPLLNGETHVPVAV